MTDTDEQTLDRLAIHTARQHLQDGDLPAALAVLRDRALRVDQVPAVARQLTVERFGPTP